MCRVVVTLAVIVWALPALSQTVPAPDDSTRGVEFLPRTLFHMTAERLSGDDPRLVWDTHFGGELDLALLTVRGTLRVVVLDNGEEFRATGGPHAIAGGLDPCGIRLLAKEPCLLLVQREPGAP